MKDLAPVPQVALRPPELVMRLDRMGSSFPTRLSFLRTLLRRLRAEGTQVTRPVWEIDAEGYGHAVYTVPLGGQRYSLVAFSTPLDPDSRTDRVIAEAWDTTYVLFDGVPTAGDLDRLKDQVPLQEAGRFDASELVLCRANKSMRLFSHVVERLAAGQQPDPEEIAKVGYLMRTTAVYGNGKFGIADRARIADRLGLEPPFQVEMLAVWLVRGFTFDLADHVARARAPGAARLSRETKRALGIGNATGLGMAPFLVNHPILLNNWVTARETALARVRAVAEPTPEARQHVHALLARAIRHVGTWQVEDARQCVRIDVLRAELPEVVSWLEAQSDEARPWDRLMRRVEAWSTETQELVASVLIEPYGALVDDLALTMSCRAEPDLVPCMTVGMLCDLIRRHYGWASAFDFTDPAASKRFWYVSEDKAEPRLGERETEPGADKEQPLDIARQVQALAAAAESLAPETSVAELVLDHPDLRGIASRVQAAPASPYAEVQDNLIGADCLPIDLLRSKLAFFGATKFDPKSDRWTRITLFQGAPCAEAIADPEAHDMAFPVFETA